MRDVYNFLAFFAAMPLMPWYPALALLASYGHGVQRAIKYMDYGKPEGATYYTGSADIYHYYNTFRANLDYGLLNSFYIVLASLAYIYTWLAFGWVDFRIQGVRTIIGLVGFGYLAWQAGRAYGASQKNYEAWQRLEERGLRWKSQNGKAYPVRLQRASGATTQVDLSWEERAEWEESAILHHRSQSTHYAKSMLKPLGLFAACLIGTPIILAWVGDLRIRDISPLAKWLLSYGAFVPLALAALIQMVRPAAGYFITQMDYHYYKSGAQFIPGGQVLEPRDELDDPGNLPKHKATPASPFADLSLPKKRG